MSNQTKLKTCPRGMYVKGREYLLCRAGSYQENESSTATVCTKCPFDTFNNYPGMISKKLCLKCAATETSSKGAVRCRKCTKGKTGLCNTYVTSPPGTWASKWKCSCESAVSDIIQTKKACSGACRLHQIVNPGQTGILRPNCPNGFEWDQGENMCVRFLDNWHTSGKMARCEECRWRTITNSSGDVR